MLQLRPSRKARRRLLLLASAVSLGLIAAACGRSGEPVVIGAAGEWTEGYGELNKRGIELAVAQINQRGGIGGRPLEVLFRDDKGSPDEAARIAEEFVANPAVTAVVGHVSSGAMFSASKLYHGNLAAVATTASSPVLSGISEWVFRVISSDSTNGVDMARFASRKGFRRVAILYENDNYGRGLMENFRANFDGTIVSVDPMVSEPADFEPYIAFYRANGVDLVFSPGLETSGLALLREARRQNFSAAFLGGDGWTQLVLEPETAEGALVGTPFTPEDARPEARRFVEAYRARFGQIPDANAALAYDATLAVAAALEKGGTTREAVRDYLAGMDASSAVAGATGPVRFDPAGDPVGKGFVMTRVRGGTLAREGV